MFRCFLLFLQEIFQLILAVAVNGDKMSKINMLGLVMCLMGITCHLVHKFSTSKMISTIPMISDNGTTAPTSCEQQLQVNYVNGNFTKQNMKLNYFSNQNKPLLDSDDAEHSESDDSQDAQQNASEVIFDILKRRDIHR